MFKLYSNHIFCLTNLLSNPNLSKQVELTFTIMILIRDYLKYLYQCILIEKVQAYYMHNSLPYAYGNSSNMIVCCGERERVISLIICNLKSA